MLRFTISHPDIHTTIVGTISPDHLKQNVDAGPLPDDVYAEAKKRLTEAVIRHSDLVQAVVADDPSVLGEPGPYGISLMAHARKEGKEAAEVVKLLRSTGKPTKAAGKARRRRLGNSQIACMYWDSPWAAAVSGTQQPERFAAAIPTAGGPVPWLDARRKSHWGRPPTPGTYASPETGSDAPE